jgi:hypothetical protein
MNQGAMPDQKITTLQHKDAGLQTSTSNNLLEMILYPAKTLEAASRLARIEPSPQP